MDLREFFERYPKTALAFSGGVDSAYLLYAAIKWGTDVKAYYFKSCFQPAFELKDAERAAGQLGAEMEIIEGDILLDKTVAQNPSNRCYHCKMRIFEVVSKRASEQGYTYIMDGTNASDDDCDRPGMKALREMKILSPLRLCGITKDEVRQLSKEAGLFTWNKPAYACLATRIPTGVNITIEILRKVEAAENIMFRLGFRDFRVRILHDCTGVRLEIEESQMEKAVHMRAEIREKLKPYFEKILLDLEGR